ncbi:MAG: hypothetical protein JSR59_22205 [Proteobacteria bacterium]|nr:hypothetical protein [Pseudomonadota bacterium]
MKTPAAPERGADAPLFALPFIAALQPLAVDDVLLAAVQEQDGAARLRVQRIREGGVAELHASPTLGAVVLVAGAAHLAIVAASGVSVLCRRSGAVVAYLPLRGVAAAAFDAGGHLWLLRERTLYRAPARDFGEPVVVDTEILAFTTAHGACLGLRLGRDGGLALVEPGAPGAAERATGIAAGALHAMRVDLCVAAEVAHVMVQPRLHAGIHATLLHRYDLGRAARLPSVRLPALRHLGVRRLKMQAWHGGAILTLAEAAGEMALCLLEPRDEQVRPVGPAGCEALDFASDAESCTAACLVVDTARPGGARDLVILDGAGAGLTPVRRHRGVAAAFGMASGGTVFLREVPGGFDLCRDGVDPPAPLASWRDRAAVPGLEVWSAAADGQGWDRRGAASPARLQRAGRSGGRPVPRVAFLPGLHKLPTAGLQSNLLQEFIRRVLATLEADGYACAAVQLPGSAGRGRSYRERAPLDDPDALAEQTRRALVAFIDEEPGPLAVLSSSLGALGLSRALEKIDTELACVLISPLYSAAAIGLPSADERGIGELRSGRCDVLVIHGSADEVAPHAQSVEYTSGPQAARRRLVTLDGEGHIYARWDSWLQAAAEIRAFLAATLRERPATERVA